MVKLLLILCLIATAGFGADENVENVNFFSVLLDIFIDSITRGLSSVSSTITKYYINGIITAFLTIIILIYATRKIREGTFEFPKDAVEIILFLTMVWFVNQCLSDSDFLFSVTSVLDIPANSILEAVSQGDNVRGFNEQNNIGIILTEQLENIFKNRDIFCGTGLTLNPLTMKIISLIKFFIWCAYAWFGFILIASIAMTYILTMIQVIFWKAFATLMIPLIYFKVTRGMTIHWAKTIIALSLISIFMIIIAIMSSSIEATLFNSLGYGTPTETGASFSLMAAIIIAKIIAITLLKEIPTMINGMLGTQAASGAGAFANSVAMGSVGAAAAGAGFAAFKGAMKGGKALGNAAKGLDKTIGGGESAIGKAGSAIANKTGITKLANSNAVRKIASVGAGLNSMRKGESFQKGSSAYKSANNQKK